MVTAALTSRALGSPSLVMVSSCPDATHSKSADRCALASRTVTTRPQSGLSFAAQVYEFYLGEGDTRFLSIFYGNFPPVQTQDGKDVDLKPLRSGRLPYETLRNFYNGFLVFASASDVVLPHLSHYQIIQNPNNRDVNGATIKVKDLLDLGRDTFDRLGPPQLNGLRFDPTPPEGGKEATQLCVFFHTHSQVFWKYDPKISAYTRWENDGEGTPLRQFTDQINQQPLTFENLVVMFVNYVRYTDVYFNIDLKFITRYPALLFRDGKMYEIYWTTRNESYEKSTGKLRPPRFIDYNGNAFPLRPGQTWIEFVQLHNPYFETQNTDNYSLLKDLHKDGTGIWEVQFSPPAFSPAPAQ